MTYGTKVRVALSRLLNAIFWGRPDVMLSTRVYREDIMWAENLINTIFFWEDNHCQKSHLWEEAMFERKIQILKYEQRKQELRRKESHG